MATFSIDTRAALVQTTQEQVDNGGQRPPTVLNLLWTANNGGTQEYKKGSAPSGTLPTYFLG